MSLNFCLEKNKQRIAMAQCSIKTEYCGSNYEEEEDMMILEIVSELVMKEMEKIQSLINEYKSTVTSSYKYNLKKEQLVILLTSDKLELNKIRDIREIIVCF